MKSPAPAALRFCVTGLLVAAYALIAGCGDNGKSGSEDAGATPEGDATVDGSMDRDGAAGRTPIRIRIAQFNLREMSTDKLVDDTHDQVNAAAEIIGRFAPDLISINEIQYDIRNLPTGGLPGTDPTAATPGSFDAGAENARRLADRVKASNPAIDYPEVFLTLGNSGFPWTGDTLGQPSYALRGWGEWVGRHNTALLSRFPILRDGVRVIHDFAWEDLPDNQLATMQRTLGFGAPPGFPLFEKSLNIVPVDVEGATLYMVMLHPVSPAFDPINPYRNHDELRGLSLFIRGELPGVEPLPTDARFVIIGDLNADPEDGDTVEGAIQQILELPNVVAYYPAGFGTGGTNGRHNTYVSGCGQGRPITDPPSRFQMQLDYILPSSTIGSPLDGAVFFANYETQQADFDLGCRASDHRLLYIDLML